MKAMAKECSNDNYRWEIGVLRKPGIITGLPYMARSIKIATYAKVNA